MPFKRACHPRAHLKRNCTMGASCIGYDCKLSVRIGGNKTGQPSTQYLRSRLRHFRKRWAGNSTQAVDLLIGTPQGHCRNKDGKGRRESQFFTKAVKGTQAMGKGQSMCGVTLQHPLLAKAKLRDMLHLSHDSHEAWQWGWQPPTAELWAPNCAMCPTH